jgi:hypothetical protein
MLDSLLTQSTATDYKATTGELNARAVQAFESGANDDFQRILDSAEAVRQEYHRESIRQELDKVAERRRTLDREALKQKEARDDAREDAEEDSASGESSGTSDHKESEKVEENPYRFQAKRTRGRTLTFGTLVAEMTLPGGFKRQLQNSLLLTGVAESGQNAMKLNEGDSPVSILKDALEGMDLSAALTSVDGSAISNLADILAQSGVGEEEAQGLLEGLVGEDGKIEMLNLLKVLTQAQDHLSVNGASTDASGLMATTEGLSSLGQFLMGLGLSPETVKAVTSEMEVGAIIQASTLQEIIAADGQASLSLNISEGNLNFLALALESMGASATDLGNLSLLLEESEGDLNLGKLLDFLATLEKPKTQVNLASVAENIQDLLLKVENTQEVVKAPVFNEILLKLSLLGDRELDKNFFELSPALQALRGGLSGIRGDAQGSGDFNHTGGNNKEDRREREERRLMSASLPQGQNGGALSGAFTGSLYDEVAGYSSQDTIAKQLKDKLIYSARRGVRRLKMNLSPESLGQLSIELKVSGNKLTANIQADSLEAYRALEKEVMALRDSLSADGIELKMTLSYAGADQDEKSFFASDGQEYQFGLRVNPEEIFPEEENSQEEDDGDDFYSGSLLNTMV